MSRPAKSARPSPCHNARKVLNRKSTIFWSRIVLGTTRDFRIGVLTPKRLDRRGSLKNFLVKGASMKRETIDISSGQEITELPARMTAPNDLSNGSDSTSIGNKLQSWVKFVEKDTEAKVQEYLEQVDAGQNGE